MLERFFFFCAVLTLVYPVQSQEADGKNDVEVSVESCRHIQMTLKMREQHRSESDTRKDDDFTAAGRACDRLSGAISGADPAQIQSSAAALRPILARLGIPPATPQEQFAALQEAASGASGEALFYKLPDLAKRAFNAGAMDKADAYSKQLLTMASQYPKNWNYGNAIHTGNSVLGRIAVRDGKLKQAGEYLLAAGATPGSPQLDSFGPNVTLAKELLEKGQSDVVLQYLALCRNFWKMDYGKLDQWSTTIRSGGTPDFTSNLRY